MQEISLSGGLTRLVRRFGTSVQCRRIREGGGAAERRAGKRACAIFQQSEVASDNALPEKEAHDRWADACYSSDRQQVASIGDRFRPARPHQAWLRNEMHAGWEPAALPEEPGDRQAGRASTRRRNGSSPRFPGLGAWTPRSTPPSVPSSNGSETRERGDRDSRVGNVGRVGCGDAITEHGVSHS